MVDKSYNDDENTHLSLDPESKKDTSNNLVDRVLKIQAKNTKSNHKQIADNSVKENVQKSRGRAGKSLVQAAQLELFERQHKGYFSKSDVHPESEFPTFLTRLPIFRPSRRNNQRELLDNENAMPFVTPWGVGKKHGPPLTTYDEDTLIALGRLRQNRLIGQPHRLPVPLSNIHQQGHRDVNVHVAQFMLSDVQKICGTKLSGQSNRMRLDSIKRLASTVIEFDTKTASKFMGTGTSVKLVDVIWQHYEDNGLLYVQFTPVMASWFENEYTYIDLSIRQQLTDTGKAVHRFLSGQRRDYQIFTKKLMTTIGYVRHHQVFVGDLRKAMQQLEDTGWIESWDIIGSGRSTPRKLICTRGIKDKNYDSSSDALTDTVD